MSGRLTAPPAQHEQSNLFQVHLSSLGFKGPFPKLAIVLPTSPSQLFSCRNNNHLMMIIFPTALSTRQNLYNTHCPLPQFSQDPAFPTMRNLRPRPRPTSHQRHNAATHIARGRGFVQYDAHQSTAPSPKNISQISVIKSMRSQDSHSLERSLRSFSRPSLSLALDQRNGSRPHSYRRHGRLRRSVAGALFAARAIPAGAVPRGAALDE